MVNIPLDFVSGNGSFSMKEIHRDTKPENLACHRLSLVVSFIQSNKGH